MATKSKSKSTSPRGARPETQAPISAEQEKAQRVSGLLFRFPAAVVVSLLTDRSSEAIAAATALEGDSAEVTAKRAHLHMVADAYGLAAVHTPPDAVYELGLPDLLGLLGQKTRPKPELRIVRITPTESAEAAPPTATETAATETAPETETTEAADTSSEPEPSTETETETETAATETAPETETPARKPRKTPPWRSERRA